MDNTNIQVVTTDTNPNQTVVEITGTPVTTTPVIFHGSLDDLNARIQKDQDNLSGQQNLKVQLDDQSEQCAQAIATWQADIVAAQALIAQITPAIN